MKKWDKQIPKMSSAALVIHHRNQLWADLRDNPDYDSLKVAKVLAMIEKLNKFISSRTLSPIQVKQLVGEAKRLRPRKRAVKKLKLSKRAVKFTLKQIKNARRKSTGTSPVRKSGARRKGAQDSKGCQASPPGPTN